MKPMDQPLLHLLYAIHREQMKQMKHGLRSRQRRNARLRAEGTEPPPDPVYHGLRRMMRYIARQGVAPVHIKNPRDYMNAPQRKVYDETRI